jgi:hypothetical protein
MKSASVIVIMITLIGLAVSRLDRDNKSWSTRGNQGDGFISNCISQSSHKVKFFTYGEDQCLAFMLI